MANGINGIQGSYNSKTKDLRAELKSFGQKWVRSYVQALNYNEKEMEKFRRFLSK